MSGKGRFLSFSRYVVHTAIILFLCAAPATAEMGKKSNICGSWNNYCRKPSGGGSSSYGGGYGNTQMMMGLFGTMMQGIQRGMEQARRNQIATAHRLNNQGIANFKRKNYHGAWEQFRNALRYSPHDKNIRNNMNMAFKKMEEQRRAAEARNRVQLAAAKKRINRMIGSLESDLTRGAPSSTLDSAGVSFEKPGGTSFFGLGGGKEATEASLNPTGDGSGLEFVQSSDSLFSKGTKYSAPVNLRPDASDQLASNQPAGADIAGKGQTAGQSEGLGFIAPDQSVPQAPDIPVPPAMRDAVDSTSGGIGQGIPTLKPEKGPAVLDKTTGYDSVKTGVMETFATGNKPKLNTRIPEPVYPPKSLKAGVLLDALVHGKGDWKESKKYLEDLQKKRPDQPHIQAALSNLEKAQGTAYWQQFVAVNKGAKPSKPFDQQTITLLRRAEIAERNKDYVKAGEIYGDLSQSRPDEPAFKELLVRNAVRTNRELIEFREKAIERARAGDYDKAEKLLEQALKRDPGDSTLNKMATIIHDRNNVQLIVHEPKHLQTRLLLIKGGDLAEAGKYQESLKVYHDAFQREPNVPAIRQNYFAAKGLLDAQSQSQSTKGAYQHISNLFAEKKIIDDNLRRESYVAARQAQEALSRGNLKQAISSLREAELRNPDNIHIQDVLIYTESVSKNLKP